MSNYIDSLGSMYRYNYTSMTSRYSEYNNSPLVYGKRSASDNYVNSSGLENLSGITSSSKRLLSVLDELGDPANYDRYAAASSDSDSLAITSSSNPSAEFMETTVAITQLATTQMNKGDAVNANEVYGGSGTQQFEINVGGVAHQISIELEAGDTNKIVQQKMAAAINKKNIGLTASVSQNSTDKTSTLNISSNNTGDDARNQFSIRDMSGSMVSRMGIDTVVQNANNAVYTVNGEEKTSKSNTVDLGDGVSAVLKKTTTGDITVTSEKNNSYAVGKVKEMVESFNRLWSVAQDKASTNSRLYNDLSAVLQSYGPGLERVGINFDSKGSLVIDEKKLTAAAEPGASGISQLETFFAQSGSYGFTTRVSRIANNAETNPSYYAGKAAENSQSGSGSDGTSPFDELPQGDDIFSMFDNNPYYIMNYNKYTNMGYLFDMFI